MKSNTNKRYKLLIDTIEKMEQGRYTGGLDYGWCCDSLVWLWKWRKITKEEMESLCNRMITIMESK